MVRRTTHTRTTHTRTTHTRTGHPGTTAVIAAGGALGALARYGLTVAVPDGSGAFPWGTLLVNVIGCALIGVLMTLLLEVWVAHRLWRPFLGIGILGGFTTFSTYAVQTRALLAAGQTATGLLYLFGTVAAALVAVWFGAHLTRLAVRAYPRRSRAGQPVPETTYQRGDSR
ncbi:CrcB protein [Actinopolymorpha cephalotaxi]|uniref:Fluoride-specific ion channel FluC n=1 Tax=Actinopolymorpha cephalotaxi TaxID=504797 RepID=A0A1I2TIV9_9ACTN|nr:fluoride efflux transporter CrcB [Actinopolymorpha cephalotaxi]NYH83110.1 CrcB protein [Actinopolymorpha cephalotaxi]SFG64834.1 CrcB protein [Actinopolymorpha cephalotaxi]